MRSRRRDADADVDSAARATIQMAKRQWAEDVRSVAISQQSTGGGGDGGGGGGNC